MIDQRKLPAQEIYVRCKTAADVAKAITTMVIRGAPAIGVAAALGISLGTRRSTYTGTQKFVDTAGRVDKFQQRMAKTEAAKAALAAAAAKKKKK